ncbi:MAG: hypothetical protein HC900_06135 [Methylacidiphilales bacterium]|nr:hypothetical protein [Candidatus Methylacidiphilales bacterium]
MIDEWAIRQRFEALSDVLDERGRRRFAAAEALAAGKDDATLLANSFIASVKSDGKVASNTVATLATALTGWAAQTVRETTSGSDFDAGVLVQRPLKDGVPGDQACAAAPFEMPYSLDLPIDEPDCWQQHKDILNASLGLCQTLLAAEDPSAPPLTADEANYLRTLRQLDRTSIDWIDTVRSSLLRNGGHRV